MQENDSKSLSMSEDQATIMVVDDDTYSVEFLSEILARQGYNVRAEEDPGAALQSALSDPPDLVLLDIRMPGMDGFTFCEALKADARTGHVPVIFISGLFAAEDKVRAFEIGAADYLTKPFSDIEMLARIRAQLNLHRLQTSLEQQVEHRTAELKAEIAERKESERQRERLVDDLKAKNRELENFAYSVSHDLKTPMITIRGFLSRLEQDIADGNSSNVHDDVQRITGATKKMQEMLEDVLELSRVGRLVSPLEDVSLSKLALEAAAAFDEQIRQGKVQLDVAADMPDVHGDRPRLLSVFQNLIGNALIHAGKKTGLHIEIGGELKEGEAVCFVRDNGIGIEPRFHEKIFGLFERLDPRVEGSGVGLALCRRIIDAHGGHIRVESGGKGKGSTFHFTLRSRPETSS